MVQEFVRYRVSLAAGLLRIGNGVGKQGYGNRPPIDDRNPIRKFSIDCLDASKTKEKKQPQVTRHCRESRRKADTEFQYRPRIVDTDIDCGPRFCGPRFSDGHRTRLPLGRGRRRTSKKFCAFLEVHFLPCFTVFLVQENF